MSDIVLMGATYPSVPAVQLPKAGGGTATFTETAGSETFTENGTYDVTSLAEAVVDVSGGGGDDGSFKAVIERTATTPTLPSDLTKIGAHAFYGCTNLALASLPSGIGSIGESAFQNCTNLALTSLPSGVTSIGSYAFQNCTNLALTSLPSGIGRINSYAFYYCTNLALASLPSSVTYIGDYSFIQCANLALTELPSSCQYVGSYAFSRCANIRSISCEGSLSTFSSNAFTGNSSYPMKLESVSFPKMTTSSLGTAFGSTSAANACKLLAFADIGKTRAIAANAFANCYALATLVLRRTDAICALSNVSAFTNTPMRGYGGATGTVYVPQALIPTYQAATNWKTLYDAGTVTFAAIEGSEYEI